MLDESERAQRIGAPLPCLRCDRAEIPDGYEPTRRTPEFDESSIPDALTRSHNTKPGVWGLIHVADGQLEYGVCEPLSSLRILSAGEQAVIVAEVEHSVRPVGAVRFCVEFWHSRERGAAS